MSQREAEAYRVETSQEICISVTSHGLDVATLDPGFQDVLRLQFDDLALPLTLSLDAIRPAAPWNPRAIQPFDARVAAQVWQFVARHHATATRLVIHCQMGVSRSRGIALGVASVLRPETVPALELASPKHNPWVREVLRRTVPRVLSATARGA